jgi:hypothetical protein
MRAGLTNHLISQFSSKVVVDGLLLGSALDGIL